MRLILIILIFVIYCSSASAAVYDCMNCSDCNEKIISAVNGDIIRLMADDINIEGNGINFNRVSGITFDGMGHRIGGIDSYSYNGITLRLSDMNTIKNVTVSDFRHGIYIFESLHDTIENVTSISNVDTGIAILYNSDIIIKDSILKENSGSDLHFAPKDVQGRLTTVENVTGSGGRPIIFYNSRVNISDEEYSMLYLCDADNSIITNVTIAGSDTITNNGFRIFYTDNATIKNITSSDNFYGVSLFNSNDNVLKNVECNNIHHYAVYLSQYSTGNTLDNFTINHSSQAGMYLSDAGNNIISNASMNHNPFGIRIDDCPGTIVNNSYLRDNSVTGITLHESPGCKLYNNYFDNADNIMLDDYFHQWNATVHPGRNIVGGRFIGGNYWSDYTGNDSDEDGFGDIQYQILSSDLNIDYWPLVYVDIERICGDVDGNKYVSANDVIQAYSLAVDPDYMVHSEWAADADGNNYITANDVVEIYSKAVNPDHILYCK